MFGIDLGEAWNDFTSDPLNVLVPAVGLTKAAVKGVQGGYTDGDPKSQPQSQPQPKPQAQGWSGPNPYVSSPGLQPGQSQSQFSGVDFTKPGASEQYYSNNQSVWQSPSFGEVNAQGLVSQYTDPSDRPQLTNNSTQAYSDYRAQMPTISSEPGFGSYFDNAKNRASESINQTMAARGAYGSSAANDQISRAYTDLEGQRALKEADYNLARLGEQRNWLGLGGQLAGQSDSRSDAASQDAQRWASLLGQLGLDASRLGLSRTNAGADAAANAQTGERNRGNDYFQNEMAMGDRIADLYRQFMGPALDNDASMMSSANSGGIAGANAQVGNEQANAQTTSDFLKTGASVYDYFT